MAHVARIIEKLFDEKSPLPGMVKASRAVIEKRKKELENGSANVRIRCEHMNIAYPSPYRLTSALLWIHSVHPTMMQCIIVGCTEWTPVMCPHVENSPSL